MHEFELPVVVYGVFTADLSQTECESLANIHWVLGLF